MVLTRPAIQYPINIAFILGIFTTNLLIPPTYAQLIGGYRHTWEGDEYLCLRSFPKYNLILTRYMLIAWWLHLLDGLGHYAIRRGGVA